MWLLEFIKVIALVGFLQPFVSILLDEEYVNASPNISRISLDCNLNKIADFSPQPFIRTMKISIMEAEESFNFIRTSERKCIRLVCCPKVGFNNQACILLVQNIQTDKFQCDAMWNTALKTEKGGLQKHPSFIEWAIFEHPWEHLKTINSKLLEIRCDGTKAMFLDVGIAGKSCNKIGMGVRRNWCVSGQSKEQTITHPIYLAPISNPLEPSNGIAHRKLAVSPNNDGIANESNNYHRARFNLGNSDRVEEQGNWKYYRIRFFNNRIGITRECEKGIIHNLSNVSIDLSRDGEHWFHLIGECMENLPKADVIINPR